MGLTTALIVDDDETCRQVALGILNTLGIADVQLAENGALACRILNAMPTPPDLVLLDIFMPEKDGIELVGELVERQFAGGIILMSSAEPQFLKMTNLIATQRGLHVWAALKKPLSVGAVAIAIEKGLADQAE